MRHIPLLAEEGWLRHQRKCREATKAAQTGAKREREAVIVVSSAGLSKGRRTDHPVRDKSERIHFLDVADTPPLRGGECARRKTLSKKLKVAALLPIAA